MLVNCGHIEKYYQSMIRLFQKVLTWSNCGKIGMWKQKLKECI